MALLRAGVALCLFVFVGNVCALTLLGSPPVATIGEPFKIIVAGISSQSELKLQHKDEKVNLTLSEATFEASPFFFETIAYACPIMASETFSDLVFEVKPKHGSTRDLDSISIGLQEGARLSLDLQVVRKGGHINAIMSLKNTLYTTPITDLSCSFNATSEDDLISTANFTKIYYRNDKNKTDTSKASCQKGSGEVNCTLGYMLGRTEMLLEVPFPDPENKVFTLTAVCNATFGLATCPEVVTDTDSLHPGVIFTVPATVIAGNNLTLKVSGVEDIQDCTITLPNAKDYHLAGSVSGCTQSSQNITCHVNKSVEVPVHVDSSASKADKSDFHLKCEKIKTVQQGTVKVDVSSAVGSVDFGGFLRVLKPARFNVSIIVTNAGPSDLKDLQCDFSYEDDVGALSHPDGDCTFDNHTGIYTCPIKIGTVPGLDAKGKAGKVNHTVTFEHVPEVVWAISSLFSVKCPGNKEIHRNFKVNDTDFMVIGKPPVETPMQNDGYFWTYAIVIVNLFVIALVVFVGMWWRNRAIAKTMEGRGGAGGFTEMELFSEGGGRLPMSKAD